MISFTPRLANSLLVLLFTTQTMGCSWQEKPTPPAEPTTVQKVITNLNANFNAPQSEQQALEVPIASLNLNEQKKAILTEQEVKINELSYEELVPTNRLKQTPSEKDHEHATKSAKYYFRSILAIAQKDPMAAINALAKNGFAANIPYKLHTIIDDALSKIYPVEVNIFKTSNHLQVLEQGIQSRIPAATAIITEAEKGMEKIANELMVLFNKLHADNPERKGVSCTQKEAIISAKQLLLLVILDITEDKNKSFAQAFDKDTLKNSYPIDTLPATFGKLLENTCRKVFTLWKEHLQKGTGPK